MIVWDLWYVLFAVESPHYIRLSVTCRSDVQFTCFSLCFQQLLTDKSDSWVFSNPAEMLQEKVSAVTDECMSRVQSGRETDLLPDRSRLGLSTAPTVPNSSEPDQVRTESTRQEHTVASHVLFDAQNEGGLLSELVQFNEMGWNADWDFWKKRRKVEKETVERSAILSNTDFLSIVLWWMKYNWMMCHNKLTASTDKM